MEKTNDTAHGLDVLYDSTEPAIFPEKLDSFMQNFGREAALGKVAATPDYWEKRIEYMQDRLRGAEVARKAVAVIASDAATLIEKQPEKFAELPPEQQAILSELAGRIEQE